MTLEKSRVNIRDMLAGLYNLTVEWGRGQKIEVKLSCPDDIGLADLDERRIKQGLLNLVRNAIAYTPAGGQITLAAARLGGDVALSVIDTGPGIATADQGRIFRPFEKTTESRQNEGAGQGGAGLGLSLVKNIVDLHGGRIDLKSAPGTGSAFTLIIPADGQAVKETPVKKTG